MRVVDIVEMMADGATRAEVLAGFPYIEDDDIGAALLHAARRVGGHGSRPTALDRVRRRERCDSCARAAPQFGGSNTAPADRAIAGTGAPTGAKSRRFRSRCFRCFASGGQRRSS